MHTCRLCGADYDDMRGQKHNLCPVCTLRCRVTSPVSNGVVYMTKQDHHLGIVQYHVRSNTTEVFLVETDGPEVVCPTAVDHTSTDRVIVFIVMT